MICEDIGRNSLWNTGGFIAESMWESVKYSCLMVNLMMMSTLCSSILSNYTQIAQSD